MRTFEEAVSNFVAPGAGQFEELKDTFKPTLATLRDQYRAFQKQKPAWLSRVSNAQARRQLAVAQGCILFRVEYLLEQLRGGQSAVNPGSIQGTENQMAANIQTIEGLRLQDLPNHDWWRTWYNFPKYAPNAVDAIEQSLSELDTLVADGGELQRMLEGKSVEPASTTVDTGRA
jgi:hypothetical protein